MRLALLVLLAGCLDEPTPPVGHGYEMRDQVLVADIDADGFDDVVTWGHDGDPRVDSQVFVRWGGALPLSADANVTLAIPATVARPFHETVTVMYAVGVRALFALACDGNGPDDPPSNRICQLWKLPITGRTFGDPVSLFTSQFNASGFGGFTRSPAPVFVAQYQKSVADPRMLVGDHDRLLDGPLGGDITDVEYTAPMASEKPQDVVSALPPPGVNQEKLLVITSVHAGLFDGPPIDAGSGVELFDTGDPATVSSRDIGDTWAAVIPQNSMTMTFLQVSGTFQLARFAVMLPRPPQQFSLANIGGVSLVDIDPTGLSVYENLDSGAGTFAATDGPIETESETVLAVGKFDSSGSDSIMIFDATDRTHAPKCFHLVATSLEGC
jgi:hypothetical protein